MIHVVGKHSLKGSCAEGVGYMTQEKDHDGVVRESVEVLRGNAQQIIELEKTLNTKHTYIHTSLSFTGKEADMLKANPEKAEAIMDDYIEQMAAGLPSPDRLPVFAVKHGEPNKFHIEFMILRMDLQTGKSYQPSVKQRGDIQRFQHWNVVMQDKHGLENPNSIEHQKTSTWSKNLPKQAKAIRDEVDNKISAMVEANQLNNRQQIIDFINKTKGMEVARVIPSAISIKVEGQKTNIKLKGALYADTFTDIKSVERAMEQRAEINVDESKQRLQTAMSKLAKASHYKYEEKHNDMGVNPISYINNNINERVGLDMVSVSRDNGQLQNINGRQRMGKSNQMRTNKQLNMGATEREVTPNHKIFNGVIYDGKEQSWSWKGSYGYVNIQATEDGYSLRHGNKMEWVMAAQLLKEQGVTHVTITCSTEQSIIRAIAAHEEAGLTITDIGGGGGSGLDISKEKIQELINEHTKRVEVTRDSVTNNRIEQEGSTGNEIDELSKQSTKINQSITKQSDIIEQASHSVEQFIIDIESNIEQQQVENEEEFTF